MDYSDVALIASDYPKSIFAQCVLLVSVPFSWYLCRAILRASNVLSAILLPAVFAALYISVYHVVGLGVGRFYGTVVYASIGLIFIGAVLRFGTKLADPLPDLSIPRPAVIAVVICTIMIFPAVFWYDFHDKAVDSLGHLTHINAILNDVYPPRNTYQPEYELPYHYGVNLAAALAALATGSAADRGLDLLTFVYWGYSLLIFYAVVTRLLRRTEAPWWVVPIGAFAGGFPWLANSADKFSHKVALIYHFDASYLNPPIVSYFFQHPWTIGLPVALAILHLSLPIAGGTCNLRNRFAIFALFFLTLAISNVTVALTFSATIMGFFTLELFWRRDGAIGRMLMSVALFLLTAACIVYVSGFGHLFDQVPQNPIILTRGGIAHSYANNIMWNLATFGALLPLGIWGLVRLKTYGLIPMGLALGGVLIVNVLEYEKSWDIVKFATVAQIALSLGAAVTLVNLSQKFRNIAIAFGATVILPGVSFCVAFFTPLDGNPFAPSVRHNQLYATPALTEDEALVIHFLRREMDRHSHVLVPRENILKYTIYGGLPQFHPVGGNLQVFLPSEAINARRLLLEKEVLMLSGLVPFGVHWVVQPKENASYRIEDDLNGVDVVQTFETETLSVLSVVPHSMQSNVGKSGT